MSRMFICLFAILSNTFLSQSAFAERLIENKQIISGQVFSLESSVLKETREIFVSLPESYRSSTHKYPVIYVLDAEFLFDLTRSSVAIRASRNYMPESIIVGIPNNTGKRLEMAMEISNDEGVPFFYGDNIGQADKYLEFFRKELFPEIESKLRVNKHRTIIGLSPTFGPVFEAFWSEPDLFSGYIVLAAEIGQKLKSGKTIAQKLYEEISNKKRKAASIYVGTSSKDIEKRGSKEAAHYVEIPEKLKSNANPNIRYKFEVVLNQDHYGMTIPGIQSGLDTIYPRKIWLVDYKKFWRSEDPAKALAKKYDELSKLYGFEVVPLEKAFYSIHNLTKTAEIMARQKKYEKLIRWLELAVIYYPKSPELYSHLSEAYRLSGRNLLAKKAAEKLKKLKDD